MKGNNARNDAHVLLTPSRRYGTPGIPRSAEAIANSNYNYAIRAIHETIHLAGQKIGGYSDFDMAKAAFQLMDRQYQIDNPLLDTNDPSDEEGLYSIYFDDELRRRCPQVKKR